MKTFRFRMVIQEAVLSMLIRKLKFQSHFGWIMNGILCIEDDEHDEDWNAEHESESDGYTYAYTRTQTV